MSDNTPRMGLPELAEMQEMNSAQINDALIQLDALGCLSVKGLFVNTPPPAPTDGDAYVTGGAPGGAWSGNSYKIAYCLDGGWRIFTPFDGLVAHRADTDSFTVYRGGQWTGLGALMAGPEVSIASAATCDLGAAAELCVLVTGTATITSLGTGANVLRLVRFAQALTLTHNAASLILPGGADIVTAAGDHALFLSDGAGNWRCCHYARADGRMAVMDSPAFTGTLTGAAASFSGLVKMGGAASPEYGAGAALNGFEAQGDSTSKSAIFYMRNVANGANGWIGIASFEPTSLNIFVPTATGIQWGGKYDGASNYWLWAVGGSEKMRLDSAGLMINTTASGGWSGAANLAVRSTGTGAARTAVEGYRTAADGSVFTARVDNDSTAFVTFFKNTTAVGSITTDGSSTAYNTTSDGRLKTVPAAQGDYRAAIKALWVGDYVWNRTGEKGFGVIAQQAWEHMPWHMGVQPPAREDGQWQAAAEPFAHLALWGVKDLYALVEQLAARLAALEARP